MKVHLLTGLALCLAATTTLCPSQSYVTSPPGFVTTANTGLGSYSITFGAYDDERSQIADGNYKGTGFVIKEIALRRDEQAPNQNNASGRTWSNFALKGGDCNYGSLTNNWDTNFIGTPTTLISGTLKWPGPGTQNTTPEPWGDLFPVQGGSVTVGGNTTVTGLLFPFTTPYVYTGSNDLLWEFQFFGGTLDNATPWGGFNKSYYLDATSNRATVGGGVATPTPFNAPIMTSCASSGATRVGYGFFRVVTYAVHNDPNLPPGSSDSFELSFAVRGVPNASGIVAMSLWGSNDINSPLALYIGGQNAAGEANIGCMPLGLDASKPWVFHTVPSTGTGNYESSRFYLKYDQTLAGLTPVYSQFAFNDPTTNRFLLSGTGSSLIFDQPALQPWRSMIIGDFGSGNRGPQPRSGTGPTPSEINVPTLRYTR